MEDRWVSYDNYGSRFRDQNIVLRYFIQGFPFAIMSIGLLWLFENLFWAMFFTNIADVLSILMVMAIAFIVLMGALNSIFAAALWDIRPKQTCLSFAGQGLLLVFMSYVFDPFFVAIFLVYVSTYPYGLLVYATLFVVLAFIGGYLGKNIASEFEREYEKVEQLASVHDRQMNCPYCGASVTVSPSRVDDQRGITCPSCGEWFGVFDRGPTLE